MLEEDDGSQRDQIDKYVEQVLAVQVHPTQIQLSSSKRRRDKTRRHESEARVDREQADATSQRTQAKRRQVLRLHATYDSGVDH